MSFFRWGGLALLAMGACGGSGDNLGEVIVHPPPLIDARPVPHADAMPKPPRGYLDVEWSAVVDGFEDPELLRAAIMTPTGIVIVSTANVYLADKGDGHLIAKTPLPRDNAMKPGFYAGAAVTGTLNMVVVTVADSPPLAVYQYDNSDLSVVKKVDVSTTELRGAAIANSAAGIYLLVSRYEPAEDGTDVMLFAIGPDGATPLADFGYSIGSFETEGVATDDGHLLFCHRGVDGVMELTRIDPTDPSLDQLVLGDGAAIDCRVVASPDRVLVYWYDAELGWSHWDIVSRDGTTLMGSYIAKSSPLFSTHTYAAGAFLASFDQEVWAIDAQSATALGRYQIRIPPGRGHEELVSDGTNLYAVVVADRDIRLLKLAPLPTD